MYLTPSFEALLALDTCYLEFVSPPLKLILINKLINYQKEIIKYKSEKKSKFLINYKKANPYIDYCTTYRSKIKEIVARISNQKKKLLK